MFQVSFMRPKSHILHFFSPWLQRLNESAAIQDLSLHTGACGGKKNITKEQDHAWLYKSTIKEKKSAFCTSCKWRRDYLGWAWNIMRLASNGVIMVWFTLLRSVMAFCRCVMSKSCSGVIMGFYWLWKWISRSSTNVDACLISSEWKS